MNSDLFRRYLDIVTEMDKSAPQPGRDGKVSHSTYGSRDKKGSDYFTGREAPGKPVTAKQMSKDAVDILKKQGVAEGDVIQGPWSGMNRPEPGERYAIVRTRPDGTRDFAAGHFDSWQKAKQELQKFLKHELHTELGHQFEIVKKKGVAEGSENNFVQSNLEVWYKGRFAGWATGKVYDDPYGKAGKMVAFEPNPSEFPGDEGRILSLPYSEVSLRKSTSIGKLKGPEQGVAEGEKKPHPETWHDVDKKLGKQVDKMSQAEKVKKGYAHPDTLKKKGVAEGKKTLANYIAESERAYSQPVQGDYFAINIREETLFETWVCDETADGIVIYADEDGLALLEHYGYLGEPVMEHYHIDDYQADSDGQDVDIVDQGEYDYEGDQARDQLKSIVRAAHRLNGIIDDDDNLPEWVQMKITKAEDYIDTAADYMESNREQDMDEAKYQGREVPLGKPMAGDVKKSKVYVRGPKGNVVKVNFGQKGMKIKKNIPGRRKNFRARHNCDNPGPRWKARYWSCRAW